MRGLPGMRAILIGCSLLASIASPAFAGVKEGVDAWMAGDYPKAVGEWRVPAQNGDADAQFNLGQAYKLGRGVQADQAIALDWYRKAAMANHEQAQATLGLTLFQSGQRDEAMIWLKKAADHGEPRAQYVVGTAYFNGDSLPKDWARAYALMTRAKAAGIGAASTSLTQMDQLIPDSQRQAGLALAREMERTEKLSMLDTGTASTPLTLRTSTTPRPSARVSTPVGQVSVPPSQAPAAVVETPQPAAKPAVAMAVVKPAPVKPKPVAIVPPPGGGWKVQLGAFSSEAAAKAGWTRISAGAPPIMSLSPNYVAAGTFTRLQAGPLASRAAAVQACAAVKVSGSACFPIAP
ncbi:MAG: SEL1-like repeat protein [Sphingomonas sp.]|nr:SEL1-like repeat protein [Sphingomonas sp.]